MVVVGGRAIPRGRASGPARSRSQSPERPAQVVTQQQGRAREALQIATNWMRQREQAQNLEEQRNVELFRELPFHNG